MRLNGSNFKEEMVMGKNREAPDTSQLSLIPESDPAAEVSPDPPPLKRFRRGDPDRLFIGDLSLKRYLEQADKKWVMAFRDRLFDQDVRPFLDKYKSCGRRPFHPFVILGLILYGAQMGRWSLRELEDLARLDLGAWYICGGLQPDHSTIGDFIHLHAELLTEDFFIKLTSSLLKRLGLSPGVVAGDGTVIEAASSRISMLKHEAAKQAAAKAEKESGKASDSANQARKVLDTVMARDAERKRKGNGKYPAKVCPEEPEAVLQPRKDGVTRPAYKPSILADPSRLIVGQHVDGSSEMAAVEPMLEQFHDVTGGMPELSLWDAAYNCFELLKLSLFFEMDMLCGVGQKRKKKKPKRFPKSDFTFDETRDVYICPMKQTLSYRKSGRNDGGAYREYQCRNCGTCERRERCTKSKSGRSVLRYEGEELKEAMREAISHPAAKKRFRYRKAMVEPPFGDLRYRQGLNRFHRKGAKKVRVEFSLHCMAYNLRLAIRLEESAKALYIVLFGFERAKIGGCRLQIAIFSPISVFVLTIEVETAEP